MSHFDYKPFYRRNLPHIQPLGATFFITFRLAGSLPQVVVKQWTAEKCRHQAEQARMTNTQEQERREWEWRRRWFRRFEEILDQAQSGPVWLKDERIAAQVSESLHYRDGKVYRLDAYCIMSNHVHVVFEPLITPTVAQTVSLPDVAPTVAQTVSLPDAVPTDSLHYRALARIMQSLKGYTAYKANRLLGHRGAFWEHESYDHYVRNEREWERIVAYVLNNPVKAGLVQDWREWRWSYYRYAEQRDL